MPSPLDTGRDHGLAPWRHQDGLIAIDVAASGTTGAPIVFGL
jgi:hypothetical protein